MLDDVDETHELIGLARELAEEVFGLAGALLKSGVDIARVQRKYVSATLDQLAEAEAQALLSDVGDSRAHEALEGLVAALDHLLNEAHEERERQVESD